MSSDYVSRQKTQFSGPTLWLAPMCYKLVGDQKEARRVNGAYSNRHVDRQTKNIDSLVERVSPPHPVKLEGGPKS